jgi:hypothetical protein
MSTGFYRVLEIERDGQKYFRYQVRNKLINKEITRKDIYELKQAVEEAGLLWGIVNPIEANKNKGKYNLEVLRGKYGGK